MTEFFVTEGKKKKTNDNLRIKNKKELKIFELKTLLGTFFCLCDYEKDICPGGGGIVFVFVFVMEKDRAFFGQPV
jgi:hypothetical protein